MTFINTTIKISVLAASLLVASLAVAKDESAKYKLKPGAEGKLCLDCHAAFKETIGKPYVHTPLKKGECTGCHNPHTSSHGKLLSADGSALCYSCHSNIAPANAKSVHKVVAEGSCRNCHDPHASAFKFNLTKSGNLLCAECHKEIAAAVGKAKFKHRPVEDGCVTCHLPHASANAPYLLKADIVPLCTGCHRTDRPIFLKQHLNYPVANSRCTSCHDPHGSDRGGILYNNVHKPVSTKMCNQCHEDASSANPLKTKKEGIELCRACHSSMVNQLSERNRIHWPVLSKGGCLTCHNPHASIRKGLLKSSMLNLCGDCHQDTIKRQENSVTKHEPVMEGACTSCHEPHASDYVLLAKEATVVDLCGNCHDWQRHSSHPIGEKARDMRNKNLSVQCLSCHRSHGTENKGMLPFKTTSDLCLQCHIEYKR